MKEQILKLREEGLSYRQIVKELGVTTPQANKAKSDLTPEEFFNLCIKVLTYNNYTVTKNTAITGHSDTVD